MEIFIHKISKLQYRIIIYDLFAACLNNAREVQKQIGNKSLELKFKLCAYREERIKDKRLFSIIGDDRHICKNNNELNNLQTEEDYPIQSILIYQYTFNCNNHQLILQSLSKLSTHYQKFQHYIKKYIKIIEYILDLYDYENSNSIMNINHEPTINITTFYICLLKDENNTIFNFIDLEEIYNFLNNFINIFQKNIPIINNSSSTVPIPDELHIFIYRLFIKASGNKEYSLLQKYYS